MVEAEYEITELELQRCVDGELSRDECRRLLQQLERTGTAWRELALLFVENRLIGQGCREFVSESIVKTAAPLALPRRRGLSVSWPLVAAALVVGAILPWLRGPWRASPQLSNVASGRPPATEILNSPGVGSALASAVGPELRSDQRAPATIKNSAQPIMELNLVSDGGQERLPIPVYSQDRAGEVLSNSQARFPEEMLKLLRQQGLELEQKRNLIVYPLEGGGRVVIPADEVRVRSTLQ